MKYKLKSSLKYQKIVLFPHKCLWSFIHFCATNKNYSTENAGFQPSLSISSKPPAPASVMLNDRRILIPVTQSHINNRALSSALPRLCNSCTLLFPSYGIFFSDIKQCSTLLLTLCLYPHYYGCNISPSCQALTHRSKWITAHEQRQMTFMKTPANKTEGMSIIR